MTMDWTSIIAAGGSFLLGIGAVWAVVSKFLPKIIKYVSIANDALALVQELLNAIEDGKVEDAEVKRISEKALKLKADFKSV